MDDVLKNILIWLYISVAAIIGFGVIWVAGVATFWMLPEIVDPPTFAAVIGLFLRGGIISVVTAGWSFVSVLGYRKLEDQVDGWLT